MAARPETVYTVTSEGFIALRSSAQQLTLELRTVLTLVDGTCPVVQYIPFMQALAPLLPKFDQLESMGYIRASGSVSKEAVDVFVKAIASGTSVSELPSIDAESKLSGFAPL
jgi:hypothetical protein